jgi:hypothetical protein
MEQKREGTFTSLQSKGIGSSLEFPEGMYPCQNYYISLFQTSDSPKCLWHFVTAGNGNNLTNRK